MTTARATRRGLATRVAVAVAACAPLLTACGAVAQPCRAQWEGGFTYESPNDGVLLLRAVRDGASGRAALFVTGPFSYISPTGSPSAALWDGVGWAPMGQGLTGTVTAALEFDDGAGSGLYIAGNFTINGTAIKGLARWRNGAWDNAGAPLINGFGVTTAIGLVVHDDGAGPSLYALASSFGPAGRLIRWTGQVWEMLGEPISGYVAGMTTVTSGPLRGIHAFGSVRVGALPAVPQPDVVWNDAAWVALPQPRPFMNSIVSVAEFHGAGGSSGVYMLTNGSGYPPPAQLYRTDGQTWVEAPPEVPRLPMRVIQRDGADVMHFVDQAQGLRTWDGAAVSTLGPPKAYARTFEYFDADGAEPERLHLGGYFDAPFNAAEWDAPNSIARLEGDRWERLGNGPAGIIDVLTVLDLGEGPALHAMMRFADDRVLLRLDGDRWRTVSVIPGALDWPRRVVRFDAGLPAGVAGVYVGLGPDNPYSSNSGPFKGVARWDGTTWSPAGGGLVSTLSSGVERPGTCNAMTIFDDGLGGGPQLIVGGGFDHAGGAPIKYIAKWDGHTWSPIGDGLAGFVHDVLAFDDGGGPRLYAVGTFRPPGVFAYSGVARWDGVSWEHLPAPPRTRFGNSYGLGVQREAGQESLIVAGDHGVARWRNGAWESLLNPQTGALLGPVDRLTAFGLGPTQQIVAWGPYGVQIDSLGRPTPAIERGLGVWDHGKWSLPLRDVVTASHVRTICPFDAGDGLALWVGGGFDAVDAAPSIPGIATRYVGRILDFDATCAADANLDGVVDMLDLNAVLSLYGTQQDQYGYATIVAGDINLDRYVDFYDLSLLLASYGTACE